jgi:UDP-N-acetylglucosamine:LPS N-acetylglucosamine transferase
MAEYGVLGKACIVVPAKHLVGGHQLQNSKIYSESFAAIVIPEDKLEEELYIKVKYLLQHKTERTEFGRKLQAITPSDAAERLAEVILGEM